MKKIEVPRKNGRLAYAFGHKPNRTIIVEEEGRCSILLNSSNDDHHNAAIAIDGQFTFRVLDENILEYKREEFFCEESKWGIAPCK